MKQLLLTATVLLATNAYIIFQLMDHSTVQVNTYNNQIFVSNCYTTNVVDKEAYVAPLTKSETSIAKCESIQVERMLQLPTTLEDEDEEEDEEEEEDDEDYVVTYNATAWFQDKLVFFKYFSIYSYE
jgi:hypothetical protein